MASMVRRPRGSLLPDIWDMFDAKWPFSTWHTVHIEQFMDEGTFVVRAELPGLDPEKDIDVTAAGDTLTISGRREETMRDQQRSEFRYGSFSRTVSLPAGADPEKISARYDKGILEIRVPVASPPDQRKIQIDISPERGG